MKYNLDNNKLYRQINDDRAAKISGGGLLGGIGDTLKDVTNTVGDTVKDTTDTVSDTVKRTTDKVDKTLGGLLGL